MKLSSLIAKKWKKCSFYEENSLVGSVTGVSLAQPCKAEVFLKSLKKA
jgi:hypothetical protein